MTSEFLDKLKEIAKEHLKEEYVATYDHVERVLNLSRKISEAEGGNIKAIEMAAILHDIGVPKDKPRHYEVGAKFVRELLPKFNVPEEIIELAANAVLTHSRYGGPEPKTVEDKILYDADVIDSSGAIGILRAVLREFLAGKYRGNPIDFIPVLEKILRVKAKTETGKKILEKRNKFVKLFLDTLKEELREAGVQV